METMFHPVSACRMGLNPDRDVVNVWLRMPGNGELSLVYTSIFPTLRSGNTNAPAIMFGEKVAGIVLLDYSAGS